MLRSPDKGYPHAWLIALFWTILIVISLSWNIARQKNEIIEIATNEAQAVFEKDLVYYRWATRHKGAGWLPGQGAPEDRISLDYFPSVL